MLAGVGEQVQKRSSGTGYDRCAEVVESVSGRAGGQRLEECAGRFGAVPDLLTGLVNAAVLTEQVQHLVQGGLIVQVRVEQLEQSRISRVV